MLRLASTTADDWADRILSDFGPVLLDHAHCEKKAASTALGLIFRYQDHLPLMQPLSEVVREELEHFELCLVRLAERGIAFERQVPSRYAAELHTALRKEEPGRSVDAFLCCALIEARSCERMKILSERHPDPEIAEFYRALLHSEARHHTLYVDLATAFEARPLVMERLRELALHEADVIARAPAEARLHSAGPEI